MKGEEAIPQELPSLQIQEGEEEVYHILEEVEAEANFLRKEVEEDSVIL